MVDDEPVVAALLGHLDVDGRAARELLATGLARRDQWLPLLDAGDDAALLSENLDDAVSRELARLADSMPSGWAGQLAPCVAPAAQYIARRSEEHTSELQSLMRISYSVFGLKKQNNNT